MCWPNCDVHPSIYPADCELKFDRKLTFCRAFNRCRWEAFTCPNHVVTYSLFHMCPQRFLSQVRLALLENQTNVMTGSSWNQTGGMRMDCEGKENEDDKDLQAPSRRRDSHMNSSYISLLMTPTVPFWPKARITIKPQSHLLTWSSILHKVYTHTHAPTHEHTQNSRGAEEQEGGVERLSSPQKKGWLVSHGTYAWDRDMCMTQFKNESEVFFFYLLNNVSTDQINW